MTERYLWAHSVMHHHNELKVTKWLVMGSCIAVWVKWLAGNEIERGIGIPTIESRASNVPIDKGNCIRIDWILDTVVHPMRSSWNMMISSDEPWYRVLNQSRIQFPLSIGTLLARDSIVGIPIPCLISLPASHFTHTVMHDPMTIHLVTLSSLWWCITEWAQRNLSVIRSDKSQSRSVSTQQTLSEIPVVHLYSHPVTLWRLLHPNHSYGIRELHNLMV